MELKTTKEKVLNLAKQGGMVKATLMELFPEAFITSGFQFGDIVKVVDGTNNQDKKTLIKRKGRDELFTKHKAVVIETGLAFETYDEFEQNRIKGTLANWMYSDLLLRFETGEEIYTSSKMCKLYKDCY